MFILIAWTWHLSLWNLEVCLQNDTKHGYDVSTFYFTLFQMVVNCDITADLAYIVWYHFGDKQHQNPLRLRHPIYEQLFNVSLGLAPSPCLRLPNDRIMHFNQYCVSLLSSFHSFSLHCSSGIALVSSHWLFIC